MAISDLRFPDRGYIARMVEACQLTDVVVAQDERGFYAASYIMPDWLAAMPTEEEAARLRRERAAVAPVKERKATIGRKAEGGPCDLIRAWARSNPDATKEEAIAQFPQFNRATVSIQFRKVRLGQV